MVYMYIQGSGKSNKVDQGLYSGGGGGGGAYNQMYFSFIGR